MTWMVDANGDGVPETPTDPTQIVIRQQTPAGVESVVTTASSPATLTTASTPLARLSTGVFQLKPGISLTTAGYWFVRAEGTGAAQASEEFQAIVDPSEFTSQAGISSRALVSLPETKDWLNQQNIETTEDLEIVRVINDISQRLHDEAEREFVAKDSGATRTFDVDVYGYCVQVGDLATLTTASPAVTIMDRQGNTIKTLDAADVTAYPLNRQSWEPIRKLEFSSIKSPYLWPGWRVQVTGTWGFPAIPGNLRQAALDAIAYVLDRDVEHYRQDLAAVGGGGEQTLMLALPPAALEVANFYSDDPFFG